MVHRNQLNNTLYCRPEGQRADPLKMLLFDSTYDKFKGVLASVAVKDGVIKKGNLFKFTSKQQRFKSAF